MSRLVNCKKFPNAWGCPGSKKEDTGFFSKIHDTTCSLINSACEWNLLPKKCCESIGKSLCSKNNKSRVKALADKENKEKDAEEEEEEEEEDESD